MRRMKEFFALCDRDFSASIQYELPSSTTVAQQEKLRTAVAAWTTRNAVSLTSSRSLPGSGFFPTF